MRGMYLVRRGLAGALAVAVAALIAACGGGGDSSSSSTSTSSDPLTAALSSGDASNVTTQKVVDALTAQISTQQAGYASLKQALFGLNADGSANATSITGIDWNPSQWSIYLRSLDGAQSQSILPNNWVYSAAGGSASTTGAALAFVGTNPSGNARYAVFGGHPFGVPGNAGMNQLMLNTVAWLTHRTSFTGFKVVVAQQSSGKESATRTWLANQYAGITINGVSTNPASQTDNRCDNAQLDACLQGVDLLVIGQDLGTSYSASTMMQAVSAAQSRGIPVLYTHDGWDHTNITDQLLAYYHLANADTGAGNFFTWYGLKNFVPASLPVVPANLSAIQALITRLEQGNFTSNWSGCTTSVGRTSCAGDATYVSEFDQTAKAMQASLRALEASGTAIFASSGYTVEKLLVLLGDKYRQTTAYSSGFTKTSNPVGFYRALFSDLASYSLRGYNVVAQNLGNFSNLFAANTSTLSQTVTVTLPTTGTKDYMTGLYVLPGRSVTLRRTDAGTGTVKFGVNMLRDTTWVFNQLDRPSNLASPRPVLSPNATVTITNPYGGPLYLFVDAAAGQPSVTVQVDGVMTHPVLRNANDPAAVAAFTNEVNTTLTNWVGITTDTLTLHSTLSHFRTSMSNYGGDLSKLIADTWTYTIKDTYELAGFNASSGTLSLPANVSSFCTTKGWDCTGTQHRRDTMQHVISDNHAQCGDGCSGNPYDQDWAFDPLGWGETHEIGHNIQPSRLRIYSGQSGEVSNNIFPLHKHIKYTQNTGLSTYATDRAGTSATVFGILKTAQSQSNPSTYAYTTIWSDTAYAANNSERLNFYRQLVEYARYYNASLSDGWELYTLLYLLERNFAASSSNWASVASSYGFGTYASYPSSMDGNDFLLVASSYIIGRDMTPVFDMWGITYSSAATTQAAAHGAAAAKLFFPMSSLSRYGANVGIPVTVTSTATYPAGY